MVSNFTYYSIASLQDGRPIAVFRFSPDQTKLPERYTFDSGWIEDKALILKLMSGDLSSADIIDEDSALRVIENLNKKRGNW